MKTIRFKPCRLAFAVAVLLYLAIGTYLVATQSGGAGGKTLTLAVPASVRTSPVYREAVREFERKNPGVSVRLLEVAGNFYQKVTVMIAGGCAPDLMWMGQSFSEFADRGIFLDVTERAEREFDLSEYPPEILALYQQNGRCHALPFGIDASFILYNRKLFREAGVPEPSENWDYGEFLAALRGLAVKDGAGRTLRYAFNDALPPEVFGAQIFDPATGRAGCDSPEMLNCLRTNLDLIYREKLIPAAVNRPDMIRDALSLFRQEKLPMVLSYTMQRDRASELLCGMEWGVALSPRVARQAQWASSQAICIYRGTPYPEEAWKLCREFQSRKFQLGMACRALPARKSAAREFLAAEAVNPGAPLHVERLGRVPGLLALTPRVPNQQELTAVFDRYRNEVYSGRLEPEAAMKQCAAEINRRIAGAQERGVK